MGNSWSESQVMMTLSGIAYYDDVRGQLKNPNYATANDWSVVWGPTVDWYGNRVYVARSASSGKYAVAIRGTDTNPGWDALINMYEDLNVLWQAPWKYFHGEENAMISQGAYQQISYLLSDAIWDGITLYDFIKEIPEGTAIAVTGHSLGANLATVLGSWISFERGPKTDAQDPLTEVYTFAAPSPGNRAFASAYNKRLPQSYRYWNVRDVVPHAWDQLSAIYSIYDSIGIPTPEYIVNAVLGMQIALEASEIYYNSYYQQTNGEGSKLSSDLLPITTDWVTEVLYQHGVNTYLGMLDAPPLQSSLTLKRGGLSAAPPILRISPTEAKVPPALVAQVTAFAMKSARVARHRAELR